MTNCLMINLLLSTLLLLFSCNKDHSPNTPLEYSVILIVGQSNTHAGIGFNQNIDAPQDGIKQLGRFDEEDMQIIDAIEPLQHHSREQGKIGFGLTFAKLLKEQLDENTKILIIPCGYGGTGFRENHWNKGDELYNDAVNRTTTFLAQNTNSKLVSILWHQGESDVGSPTYETDLDQFIVNIRNDLHADDVPFIVGGMVPYWVDKDNKRVLQQEIIAKTVERHSRLGYADPELPNRIEKTDNTFDRIHYDAAGQRELGARYFGEYLKLTE